MAIVVSIFWTYPAVQDHMQDARRCVWKYRNLDEAIRNEELEQDHLELYDCMKACIELVASFQSVSNLVRSTLQPPS